MHPAMAIQKIRSDHEYMIELLDRIEASCDQIGVLSHCNQCRFEHRELCHGNIEQLIRAFVEVTLKHNLVESTFMGESVPDAHRIAHNQAHLAIAEELKAIRVVFRQDGNGVQAIEGITQVRASLFAHFQDYDRQLEEYLLVEAA